MYSSLAPSLLYGKENAIGNFLYNIVESVEWNTHKPSTLSIEENIVEIIKECIKERERKQVESEEKGKIYHTKIREMFADYIVKVPYKVSKHFKVFKLDDSYYLPPINENPEYSCEQIELKCDMLDKNKIEVSLKGTDYKKTYGNYVHRETGLGKIVEGNFNVALFPFVKNSKEYRVQLVEKIDDNDSTTIESDLGEVDNYFERKKEIDVKTTYINLKEPIINLRMKCEGSNFNIRLEPQFNSVIPPNLGAEFSFAVDFGTTNTHVSYKDNSDQTLRLFILDNYIATLKDLGNDNELEFFYLYLVQEFLPLKIGDLKAGDKYGFPLRTLLLSDEQADADGKNTEQVREYFKDIGVYNIPFGYGSLPILGYKPHPDLKWHKVNSEYKHFLREIALLLYAKVLLTGGESSLEKTKLYFSYPLSLGEKAINTLNEFWVDFYQEFFLSKSDVVNKTELAQKSVTKVPESYAPVLYFLKYSDLDINKKLALCVDIGGGTTDCAALIRHGDGKEEMVFQSSFRFASNSIFGGTINENSKKTAYDFNCLTKKYVEKYDRILREKKHNSKDNLYENRESIFNEIVKRNNSGEINTCLFSFDTIFEERHKYTKNLKDDDCYKIVFLYYFSIIIYHLAKLLEKKYNGAEIPHVSEIVFSGNGSKVLDILEFSQNKESVEKMVQDIFSMILKKECGKIRMHFNHDESKVLTAKGSLVPRQVEMSKEATELYGKFINREKKDEIKEIRNFFDSFNDIFLNILKKDEKRWENLFGIKYEYIKKFKEILSKNTESIFIKLNNRAITQADYDTAMDKEEYVDPPMIPFEMMIFTLFASIKES